MIFFCLEVILSFEGAAMGSIGGLEFDADELLIFTSEFTYKQDDGFFIGELVIVGNKDFSANFKFANV
jgi:hypothetical protein